MNVLLFLALTSFAHELNESPQPNGDTTAGSAAGAMFMIESSREGQTIIASKDTQQCRFLEYTWPVAHTLQSSLSLPPDGSFSQPARGDVLLVWQDHPDANIDTISSVMGVSLIGDHGWRWRTVRGAGVMAEHFFVPCGPPEVPPDFWRSFFASALMRSSDRRLLLLWLSEWHMATFRDDRRNRLDFASEVRRCMRSRRQCDEYVYTLERWTALARP